MFELQPLTHRFVEDDACGDRYVEAVDGASHREADQVVAVIASDFTHAPAFAAEDHGSGLVEIYLVERLLALVGSADELNLTVLKFT